MKKLYLNDQEINISRYSNNLNSKTRELAIVIEIKNIQEYYEGIKLRDTKPGDIIKISNSNALLKMDLKFTVEELISHHINPDNFLDNVASLCFKFKVSKNITETVKDLSNSNM